MRKLLAAVNRARVPSPWQIEHANGPVLAARRQQSCAHLVSPPARRRRAELRLLRHRL